MSEIAYFQRTRNIASVVTYVVDIQYEEKL